MEKKDNLGDGDSYWEEITKWIFWEIRRGNLNWIQLAFDIYSETDQLESSAMTPIILSSFTHFFSPSKKMSEQ